MAKKVKLNLGCGVHLLKGFINVDNFFTREDLEKGILTKKGLFAQAEIDKKAEFVKADIRKLPFKDNYADYIECVDVVEHLAIRDILDTFKEFQRVLKPGGEMVIVTTNFDELARIWTNHIIGKPFDENNYYLIDQIIYGNQVGQGEFHHAAFNPQYLRHCADKTGFSGYEIRIYPTGSKMPLLDGAKYPKHSIVLSEMLLLKARK